jgi:hypothetical protein
MFFRKLDGNSRSDLFRIHEKLMHQKLKIKKWRSDFKSRVYSRIFDTFIIFLKKNKK